MVMDEMTNVKTAFSSIVLESAKLTRLPLEEVKDVLLVLVEMIDRAIRKGEATLN